MVHGHRRAPATSEPTRGCRDATGMCRRDAPLEPADAPSRVTADEAKPALSAAGVTPSPGATASWQWWTRPNARSKTTHDRRDRKQVKRTWAGCRRRFAASAWDAWVAARRACLSVRPAAVRCGPCKGGQTLGRTAQALQRLCGSRPPSPASGSCRWVPCAPRRANGLRAPVVCRAFACVRQPLTAPCPGGRTGGHDVQPMSGLVCPQVRNRHADRPDGASPRHQARLPRQLLPPWGPVLPLRDASRRLAAPPLRSPRCPRRQVIALGVVSMKTHTTRSFAENPG